MRFVATIMHQTTVLARISSDDDLQQTVGQNANRARDALLRDANRYRSHRLTDTVLARLADIYRDVVASQVLTRQGRFVTCVVRGETVSKMEGQIALLTGPDDLIMLIEAHDDAWIADREKFTGEMPGKTG